MAVRPGAWLLSQQAVDEGQGPEDMGDRSCPEPEAPCSWSAFGAYGVTCGTAPPVWDFSGTVGGEWPFPQLAGGSFLPRTAFFGVFSPQAGSTRRWDHEHSWTGPHVLRCSLPAA